MQEGYFTLLERGLRANQILNRSGDGRFTRDKKDFPGIGEHFQTQLHRFHGHIFHRHGDRVGVHLLQAGAPILITAEGQRQLLREVIGYLRQEMAGRIQNACHQIVVLSLNHGPEHPGEPLHLLGRGPHAGRDIEFFQNDGGLSAEFPEELLSKDQAPGVELSLRSRGALGENQNFIRYLWICSLRKVH